MNDKQRVTEYMDGLPGRNMRFCNPGSMGCACMGCITQATPSQVKEYLMDKIAAIDKFIVEREVSKAQEYVEKLKLKKGGTDKGL